MADIKWLPDGQKAFNKVLAAVPEAIRDTMKSKLLEMLAGKAGGQPVSEDIVKNWVKDDLPEPQRSVLMQALGMKADSGKQEEAPAQAAAGWDGNSEVMFERIIWDQRIGRVAVKWRHVSFFEVDAVRFFQAMTFCIFLFSLFRHVRQLFHDWLFGPSL